MCGDLPEQHSRRTFLNVATAALTVGALCGLAGGLVEAVSSHGLDNLTVQLVAAATAALFL